MAATAPCFERLEVVLDSVGRSGAVNMAVDEILLGHATSSAVLRIYGWAEKTVSFGYFAQSAASREFARGRPVVRRWTGGGIVEHGEDLTYSLCVPRSCPFAALRTAESYRRIHAAVNAALSRCGITVDSFEAPAKTSPDSSGGNACFERPVPFDLLVGGRKIAGGAQRRTRAGLLHQGSIRVEFGDAVSREAWRNSLQHELPGALAKSCDARELSEADVSQSRALAAAKYATAEWTNRV